MSWIERPAGDERAEEAGHESVGEQAAGGGQGQVPTKGDIARGAGATVDADQPPTDLDVAATMLDSGEPGIGLGGRGRSAEVAADREPPDDADVPHDRGGEVAGGAAGAIGGAVVGTAIAGPLGTVIGAVAGAAAGDVAGRSVEHRGGPAARSAETQDDADPRA